MPSAAVVRRLLRARDVVDRRFAEALEVRELAGLASMSQAHFSRCFAVAFGVSPHRYLLERRVERGKHLLRATTDSVLEVGLAVGFDGAASFSAAFRRLAGTSPSAYRRLCVPEPHPGVPTCWVMAWTRPVLEVSTNSKAAGPGRP